MGRIAAASSALSLCAGVLLANGACDSAPDASTVNLSDRTPEGSGKTVEDWLRDTNLNCDSKPLESGLKKLNGIPKSWADAQHEASAACRIPEVSQITIFEKCFDSRLLEVSFGTLAAYEVFYKKGSPGRLQGFRETSDVYCHEFGTVPAVSGGACKGQGTALCGP